MTETVLEHGQVCPESPARDVVRGDLQSPNTESGPARALKQSRITRVLTAKVVPNSDQWKRLRELAWQAMTYKNACMRALWAQSVGLRIDPAAGDKNDITKFVRKHEKGELSSAAYTAAETEVKGAWQRDGRRIMAGAPWSQWRQNDNLSIRDTGVLITQESGRFFISLSVQHKDCAGGCWVKIPFAEGTQTDNFLSPLLDGMANATIRVARATVIFKPNRGKTLIKLAYSVPIMIPPMGERIATVSNINGRFLVRCELATIDHTGKLTTFAARKQQWDAIRRRVTCQIGKRQGHARSKRKVFARVHFDDWAKTHIHQWTREIIDWCAAHGVGRIVLADLGGGDWPAHLFEQFMKYKGAGIEIASVESASLNDASTERAATAEIKKAQRKSRKLGEAARTLHAAVG